MAPHSDSGSSRLTAVLLGLLLGCGGAASPSPDAGPPFDGSAAADTAPDRDAEIARDAPVSVDTMASVPPDAQVDRDAAASTTDVAAADAAPPADTSADLAATDVASGDAPPAPPDANDQPRRLSLIVANGPWKNGDHDGLAADAQHRVYHIDGQNLFMVEGGMVSTYLTLAEAATQLGMRAVYYLHDIDLPAEGPLHVLLTGSWPDAGDSAMVVARSSGPHLLTTWKDLSTYTALQLSVIDASTVTFIDYDGLWTATTAGKKLVFPASMLYYIYGGAGQELAVQPTGTFLYEPGNLGGPLLRGKADGSSVGVLYQATDPPIHGQDFLCTARDPRGGFFVLVNDLGGDQPRVYHLAEDAKGTTGITHLVTEPSFGEAMQAHPQVRAFGSCSMATAPDGTIYVQTGSQLWEVSPP